MNYPKVKDWELYFKSADGEENREAVVKAFAEFFEDCKAEKLEIPGKTMLGGLVYGREGFKDGELIFTSSIKTIEKIERSSDENGNPLDLLRASTATGSEYYLYSDEYNAYMFLMLGDIIHMGKLSPRRNRYVMKELRSEELL